MKQQLEEILNGKRLSVEEARVLMHLALQESTNGAQLAALLTLLRARAVTLDELDGFSRAVLELATLLDLSPYSVMDLCGTGGDNRNTFNISTATAFVLAGAGYKVAKHGNYGVSSMCGSSNVLEELGVKFSTDREVLLRALEATNVCFLHAPLFHPILGRAQAVRRELGFRTVFNMLGPLVNPAQPAFQINGVYDRPLLRLYGYLLARRGAHFATLFTTDGYDEVTLTAPLEIITRAGRRQLQPEDFGLFKVAHSEIKGGASIAESAKILVAILEGRGSPAQQAVVTASAGLAMWCSAERGLLIDHVEQARETISSGRALKVLKDSVA